jgi:Holliday junction resolvasome RuvABC endonuclease subunit
MIISGTVSFKAGRYEGGGMRYLRFVEWLDGLPLPEAVYFEEVRRHAGTDAAHVYGGFLASLTSWCERRKVPYGGVPVGTIKAHVTGKGNASKDAMMVAMQAKGFSPCDDNEADALAIMSFVIDTAQPKEAVAA